MNKIKARLFQWLYLTDFIRAAYEGLLGREPDPEGFEAYRKALVSSGDLTGSLAGMASSDEFRKKNFAALAPELVQAAYRGLLAREADPSGLISYSSKLKETEDLAEILRNIIASSEFLRSQPINTCLPIDLDEIVVDTHATNDQLAACIAKIREAWTHLGITRPHFSVITKPQFLPENLSGTIDKFFASGEREAAKLERILARHGCLSLATKTCVEYGCGVGRVTMGLAHRFGQVHGYDISPSHLSYAELRAEETGTTNVKFHLCSDSLLSELEKCDVFYSAIVFQHNPPPVIRFLIKNSLRALKPEGIAVFQVPTYRVGYGFNTIEWLNSDHDLDMQMHCLPQKEIVQAIAEEQCVLLEVREDDRTDAPDQFLSNTFVVQKNADMDEFRKKNFAAMAAPDLVRAIFKGLLGREPESEAAISYAEALASTQDISIFIAEIGRSEEFRRKNFAALAPYQVRAAFKGILGREPDPEGFEAYSKALVNSGDLAGLLAIIADSDEFRKKNFGALVPDLVQAAYRSLLAREADHSGLSIMKETEHLTEILRNIIASHEFSRSQSIKMCLPLDLDEIAVDTHATDDQLSACIAKIRKAWTHLGITRPHFSVISQPQFLPENLSGTIDQFLASGEKDAAELERILARHGCLSLTTKTCVEYGCGVGRVTIGLAHRFEQVHGYDISPGHLAYAERRAEENRAKNVKFHLCSDSFLSELEKCDVFYSSIVFQHNPPPVIRFLIKNSLRALKPEGIAVFQVLTHIVGYRFNTVEWLNSDHDLDMQMHCLPQKEIFQVIAEEQCVLLEVREDDRTGVPDQFLSNTFVVQKNGVG